MASITSSLADYNSQLVANVKAFEAEHRGVTTTVFDTRPIFNTLLDDSAIFGFSNHTGFCDAYQNGTPDMNTQIQPCAPVSTYLFVDQYLAFILSLIDIWSFFSWLNTLHPLFTVHKCVFLSRTHLGTSLLMNVSFDSILAKAIATELSA